MTKTKFNEQTRVQFTNIWAIHSCYEGKCFSPEWLRAMAHDFKLIANNIEELCDIAEMEGLQDE